MSRSVLYCIESALTCVWCKCSVLQVFCIVLQCSDVSGTSEWHKKKRSRVARDALFVVSLEKQNVHVVENTECWNDCR